MSCADTAILGKTLTLYLQVTTSGEPVDSDALPTYSLYENETDAEIISGTMAKLDDAGTTGFYSEEIAITSPNGFRATKSYSVRYAGAVGGNTIATIDTFLVVTA